MRNTEVSEFIDLAYTWQERAIKAEAERCIGETECYFNLINQVEQLQGELNKYKRALVLACMDLSAKIDKQYCPADAIDFDLDCDYCDNCHDKDESVCWADFYLIGADKEGER